MKSHRYLRNLLRDFRKARGHIDAIAGNRIAGWAFAEGTTVRVEAAIGDTVIASTEPSVHRDDLAYAFPTVAQAANSGFVLDLPEAALPAEGVFDVTVTARPVSRFHVARSLTCVTMAGRETLRKVAERPETSIVGPFPKPVVAMVAALWPEACGDLASSAGQAAFAERLQTILRTPSLRTMPAIAEYVRYLQATWTHCKFVDAFFPAINQTAQESATDFHCKPNSIREIFPIVHQLYVLRSYGVAGDFAEFGCFKGFSSAMLSFACAHLGVQMHIFDSFEGLPPVEGSGYRAGEYAGSLDEVEANVARFGSVACVAFHKGFFSDTFRAYRPPPLMSLWMDVDLELSSRDLMVVADRLDPRATLFSHESAPGMFVDGAIVSVRAPDNPISPMLDRFDALDRPLTGCFVRGTTGAFWARDGGIPALDNRVLIDLVESLTR